MRKFLLILLIGSAKLTIGQTAADYFNQSKTAFDNKDFKTALENIENAIKLDSSNVEFFDIKGESLKELKQYQASYDTYCKAIELFPKKSFLYNTRGILLASFHEFDSAIQDYTTAMGIAENDTAKQSLFINRAAAKIGKRDFEGAYQDLITAYQFDSTSISTLTNLGVICGEVGKSNEALKYLLKVIELDSSFYPAYGNIGFEYQRLKQYEKAIKYFDKVLDLDPNEPLGYSNRSFSKLKLGDLKGALEDIEKSINLYPANSYAFRIRALIYIEKREMEKACVDLQAALDKGFTVSYGQEVLDLQKEHCRK